MAMSIASLECGICFDLLIDPIVGACGHDFCKLCLNSWREQHQAIHDREPRELRCPLCRGVFASSPFDDIGVCLRLRDVIEALWPQQLAARREELSRLRAGSAVTAQRKRGTDARDEVHAAAARTTLQLEAEAADVRRRGTRASRRRRQARRSNSVVQATHAGGTAFNLLASMPPPPARPPPASPAAAAAADAVRGSSPWIPAASVSPQPQVHASSNAWPHWAPDELRFTMGWFEPRHATSSRSCRRARRPRAPRLAAHL